MALWTPADTATAAWYDVSDAAARTIISGAFAQLDDKSGNGRHLSQATAAARPSVQVAAVNGLDAARFDGTDDYLWRSAGLLAAMGGGYTVVIAGKIAPLTGRIVLGERSNASSQPFIRFMTDFSTAANALWNWRADVGGAASVNFDTANGWADGTLRLLGTEDTTAAIAGYLDGAAANATTYTRQATTTDTFALGTGVFSGGLTNSFAQMDLCELVIFAGQSAANRQRVEGYLAWKWGSQASLPAGHPYKASAPATGFSVAASAGGFAVGGQAAATRAGRGAAAASAGLALTGQPIVPRAIRRLSASAAGATVGAAAAVLGLRRGLGGAAGVYGVLGQDAVLVKLSRIGLPASAGDYRLGGEAATLRLSTADGWIRVARGADSWSAATPPTATWAGAPAASLTWTKVSP